jgi:ABC-type transporter Mla subunit MlaD
VGIFVIAALCALVWLVFMFGELPVFVTERKSFAVEVQFPKAPGVAAGTAVRFCGYPIGKVIRVEPPRLRDDLERDGRSYHQPLVVLGIKRKFKDIPADAEVKLISRGLSSSWIELVIDPNSKETRKLADIKRPLQGTIGLAGEFLPEELQKKLERLADGLTTFVSNANIIIGDVNNQQNFKESLVNLRNASEQAKRTFEEFENLAKDPNAPIRRALAAVEEAIAATQETLAGADRILTDANQTLAKLGKPIEELGEGLAELRQIFKKINEGEGTAAKLINDAKFYDNLVENTEVLKGLLNDLSVLIADANDKGLLRILKR